MSACKRRHSCLLLLTKGGPSFALWTFLLGGLLTLGLGSMAGLAAAAPVRPKPPTSESTPHKKEPNASHKGLNSPDKKSSSPNKKPSSSTKKQGTPAKKPPTSPKKPTTSPKSSAKELQHAAQKARIAAITKTLQSPDPVVRLGGLHEALTHYAPELLPHIKKLRHDKDRRVHRLANAMIDTYNCLQTLDRAIKSKGLPGGAKSSTYVRARNQRTFFQLLNRLSMQSVPGAPERLETLYHVTQDKILQRRVFSALTGQRGEKAEAVQIRFLNSVQDRNAQCQMIRALGNGTGDASRKVLSTWLTNKDSNMRTRALQALSQHPPHKLDPQLQKTLQSFPYSHQQDEAQVLKILAAMGDKVALKTLLRNLNSENRRTRDCAGFAISSLTVLAEDGSGKIVPLLSAKNAIKWMRNTNNCAYPPPAYIDLYGGDRIAGDITRYKPAASGNGPGGLWVEAITRNAKAGRGGVLVSLPWVKRVVWKPTVQKFSPNTVYTRDGKQFSFQTIKWQEYGIRFLTTGENGGVQFIPFRNIAELHLAERDSWDVYLDILALFDVKPETRLLQIELEDGSRLTTSETTFTGFLATRGYSSDRWVHTLRVVWCRDKIVFQNRGSQVTEVFTPSQVPLARVSTHALVVSSWGWRRNKELTGNLLGHDGSLGVFGIATHAKCVLAFDIPAYATSFHSEIAMAPQAGTGGCVKASVQLQKNHRVTVLYESPQITGNSSPVHTGNLDISGQAPCQLILTTDPANNALSGNADPINIRDFLNWLEPTLVLDKKKLFEEIAKRRRTLPSMPLSKE